MLYTSVCGVCIVYSLVIYVCLCVVLIYLFFSREKDSTVVPFLPVPSSTFLVEFFMYLDYTLHTCILAN